MPFGTVVAPFVGIRGPTHLHRVESEGRGVGSVRVGLHDVPSEDAQYDAVVGPRTDPPQGADGAPGSDVWQRARCVVACGARSFAVYAAVDLAAFKVLLFSHLPLLSQHGPVELSGVQFVVPLSAGSGEALFRYGNPYHWLLGVHPVVTFSRSPPVINTGPGSSTLPFSFAPGSDGVIRTKVRPLATRTWISPGSG